jgi:hypothetical protein
MAIVSSGAISLGTTAGTNRSISAEFGGSEPHSLSEYYDKGNAPSSGEISMGDDFYGTSNVSLNGWPSSAPNTSWGQRSFSHSTYAQVFCNYGAKHDQTNDKIHHRWTTADSSAASSYTYADQSYTGLDSATIQMKYTVSGQNTSGSTSTPSTSSGTWANMSTSTYSPVFQWSATKSSGSGTSSITSNANGVQFYVRASLSGTYYPNSTGYSSPQRTLALYATLSGGGFGGGGCPLCCVHESMLIATEEDMKSIYDINIGDKVISHNFETGQDELVEVTDIVIVDRDVEYQVNDLIMTEDHPVYLEGGRKASVNPEATKLNYKQDVDQLVIGDMIMKLDGSLEEIKTIENVEGTHKNYAIQTKHNNFYADGHLVDSVINREDIQ